MASELVMSQESAVEIPTYTIPPIATFLQRLAAFIIDSLLLGIVGQVLGWTLSIIFFEIGPYGRFIGLIVELAYFGVLNSSIGSGRTVGKRIIGITVVDGQNHLIGLGRSLLRASILVVPGVLNGWTLPWLQVPFLQWLVSIVVFGVGTATIYAMVFNVRARQGLHDIACGTYVVRPLQPKVAAFPVTNRIHLAISGALMVIAVIGVTITTFFVSPAAANGFKTIYAIYDQIQSDNRFFTSTVYDSTSSVNGGKSNHSLIIRIWCKGAPSVAERNVIISGIAFTALSKVQSPNEFDGMQIEVYSSYDIGIATGTQSYKTYHSMTEWQNQ